MAIAPGIQILLYEGTGSTLLPGDRRFAILTELLDRGYTVSRTGAGACLPADESTLVVLGEFVSGTAPSLADRNGRISIATHDITGIDAESVAALVEKSRGDRPDRKS